MSYTIDGDICVEAPQGALEQHGAPETFNTDQGSQFTSEAFTDVLEDHGGDISMDGMGRWVDNVFVERLWRSVEYEDIYLRACETPATLMAGLNRYFPIYNARRRHSSFERRRRDAVYLTRATSPRRLDSQAGGST